MYVIGHLTHLQACIAIALKPKGMVSMAQNLTFREYSSEKAYVGGPFVGSAVPDMVRRLLGFEIRVGFSGMRVESL